MLTVPQELMKLIKPTDTILDLGCGQRDSFKGVVFKRYVGVDAFEKIKPDIVHDLNLFPYPFDDYCLEVVSAIDCIEHLSKENGLLMLKEMERISRRMIVIFTPVVWSTNEDNTNNKNLWCYQNSYNLHRSHWTASDFPVSEGWIHIPFQGYTFCYKLFG